MSAVVERASWWTRWPDEEDGPLWVGLHCHRRGGQTKLVGIEVWTEEPGDARQSLGPPGDPRDDLFPWPPVALRALDVERIRTGPLLETFREALRNADDPRMARLADNLVGGRPGRPGAYGEEHYEWVAAFYRTAVNRGRRDPTQAVADQWSVSNATARSWVTHARSLDLLA